MTDKNDLFNPDSEDHLGNPQDDATDYVTELVGEGKKFKDVSSLAKGKIESDRFIQKLQSELEELRTELRGRMRLEQVLETLQSKPSTPSLPTGDEQPDEPSSKTEPLDIEKLIESKLDQERKKLEIQNNIKQVKTKLMEVYGPNYSSKLKETARILDVSEDYLNKLAGETPKAFLKLIGVDTQTNSQNVFTPPPQGRTTTSTGSITGERNKAFYDKLKKDNPNEYWSSRIQVQMHKDAIRLGEKFFT